jgi:hypothetical protein
MEAMREKWTDERLDDMNERMSEGCNRLDHEMRNLRTETNNLRVEMNNRFEATQRLVVQVGGGMFVTMVAGFLSVITQH